LCSIVEAAGKRLLTSPASAVAKTADKLTTFEILSIHAVATVESHRLDLHPIFYPQGTVIKARDGAGCEQCFIYDNPVDFNRLLTRLPNPAHYLIQPFVTGIALSISVLFNQGTGRLLCVNRQRIRTENQQFKLTACEVNISVDTLPFQQLINQIAQAIPDLWGYVGIDLIQHGEQLIVVEINPRLTSSYTGIRAALGINVVTAVLQLFEGDSYPLPSKNQLIHIQLT
jgi:tyramine---L-glutamate ligase